ncbi:ABC transporter substrate-binding protein [Anaerovorax odorimutans]|uniref:ABC transporter substrate-binding protein n=1 Tax=Anaerovorax odorimutans TaxID=109327 RepID=UPI00056B0AB5|nr:ABC transporter substrate-binding protein [Anaerovorax odorimutans]
MKNLLIILIFSLACLSLTGCNNENKSKNDNSVSVNKQYREITDMAGRKVTIPVNADKIYSTGQPGAIMLYTTAPDKLLGWCLELTDAEAEYIEPKYIGLPVLGLMQGSNDSASREEIIKRNPDVIFTVTTVDKTTIKQADELQELLGIPVVMGDIKLENLPNCYELTGKLTGEINRAKTLSDYCTKTITEAKKIKEKIPQNQRKKIYYAQGSNGLQTAAKGSAHMEVIELVGGESVIDTKETLYGKVSVNMEQVLTSDPEVIIVSYSMGHTDMQGEEIFQMMSKGQEAWQNVRAVKNKDIYVTPCLPYNWLDIPPSANRIIGIPWLGNLLYSDYYELDIEKTTREFYKLFYRVDLTEKQLSELLSGAKKK